MNRRFCPICGLNFGDLDSCPRDGTPLVPLPVDYPPPGTLIEGVYELVDAFATGGMSLVYRARHRPDGTAVAVKVLDPRMSAHPFTIERFFREARVSGLLDHPNVVRVHLFGPTAGGHQVIVMELLAGASLGYVLEQEQHVPWQRAAHILIELCDALGHAHGRNVVHRDIKPDNVQLVGTPGVHEGVKLLDFGIAYVADEATAAAGRPGQVSGTPAYMSPEQIRGLHLDGRSDLYALGVLLFEMICGRRPFLGSDPLEVCRQQIHDRPPELAACLPEGVVVPAEFHSLVKQLLQKTPSSRVPGVGALLGRLLQVLPRERWPARFRGAAGSMPAPMGGAPEVRTRNPTLELVARAQGQPVTILEVEIYLEARPSKRTVGWPDPIGPILAGWRALVEESGGLVQQPAPNTMRATFGLYVLGAGPIDAGEILAHAARLRELIAVHGGPLGLAMRACILGAEVGAPGAEPLMTETIRRRDATVATMLIRNAPSGGIVVDSEVEERLRGRVEVERLGTVRLPGSDTGVGSFLVRSLTPV